MGEALYFLCGAERGEWSQEAVADLIGVSRFTIVRWMKLYGVQARPKGCGDRGDNADYKTKIRALGEAYARDRTAQEIADRVGCARKTVSHYIRLWGWKTRGNKINFSIAI